MQSLNSVGGARDCWRRSVKKGLAFGGMMEAWVRVWVSNSFAVVLGKGVGEVEYRRAIVIPLWTTGGRDRWGRWR